MIYLIGFRIFPVIEQEALFTLHDRVGECILIEGAKHADMAGA